MIQRMVGKQAPNFEIEAFMPEREFKKVKLGDFKQKEKWVILFFYPMDFTPICKNEILEMSDHFDDFKKLNAEIVAVSTDSKYTHEVWINTSREEKGIGELNFPLAADANHSVSRDYGVLVEEEGVALRAIFIINPNGEIQYQAILYKNVSRNVDETLRVLKALQMGEQSGHDKIEDSAKL